MTRLVWGVDTQHKYEAGVDHGVFYPQTGPGVAWNGLVSVDEGSLGGELSSYRFDGIKYVDLVNPSHFQATINAFSAPEAFWASLGNKSVIPGFVLTRQARLSFGLSYRSKIDDDKGYKIHLIYNALASSNGRSYFSVKPDNSIETVSWTIDATPPKHETFRPSAHFEFDSTKMTDVALSTLEAILYGSDTNPPRLPTIDELLDLLVEFGSLLIIPEPVTGLAELIFGEGDIYTTRVPGIHRALPTTRLVETDVDGLYELEL